MRMAHKCLTLSTLPHHFKNQPSLTKTRPAMRTEKHSLRNLKFGRPIGLRRKNHLSALSRRMDRRLALERSTFITPCTIQEMVWQITKIDTTKAPRHTFGQRTRLEKRHAQKETRRPHIACGTPALLTLVWTTIQLPLSKQYYTLTLTRSLSILTEITLGSLTLIK